MGLEESLPSLAGARHFRHHITGGVSHLWKPKLFHGHW